MLDKYQKKKTMSVNFSHVVFFLLLETEPPSKSHAFLKSEFLDTVIFNKCFGIHCN